MTLERKTRLRSDPEKTRAWQDRSRKRLPVKSSKQKRIDRERAGIKVDKMVAAGVLAVTPSTIRYVCYGAQRVPEIECASWSHDRPRVELHELVKRSRWRAGALDPANCVLLCQAHHDFTEDFPEAATAAGLLFPSWERDR